MKWKCVTDEEIWLTGLRPSTVYLVSVAAVNAVGVGQPTLFAFTTNSLSQCHGMLCISLASRSQAVARTAVRTASQHLWGHVTSSVT